MNGLFAGLARAGVVLALVVITVGAWVRLTDAGLGCPDWPGCYGQLFVSESIAENPELAPLTEVRPLDSGKAWREMIHRYLAGTLGLVCLGLAALAWRNRRDPAQPLAAPLALVALVVFQGLLGMWTVTLLLKPIVVVGHLLGGFATLALLFWLARPGLPALAVGPNLRLIGVAATAALIVQVLLGGWTSANYAALACPDFPTCQTQWWPAVADFDEAFVLWRGIGIDYEGGVLDHPARVAVHFAHRLGAVAAAALIGAWGWLLMRQGRSAAPSAPEAIAQRSAARRTGALILVALTAQLALGVSIVVFGVPLAVAVAHNGVAALLLLSLINAHQRLWQH